MMKYTSGRPDPAIDTEGLVRGVAARLGTAGNRYWRMLVILLCVILAAPVLYVEGFDQLLLFILLSTSSSLVVERLVLLGSH